MASVSVRVTIENKLGLHARPAMSFVDKANEYQADIRVKRDQQAVDGKSIMQMMMLAATQGTELEIAASGADAEDAVAALSKLVKSKFGEE